MNQTRNILLAALGGAVAGALIGSLLNNSSHATFPASPINELDNVGEGATNIIDEELESIPEMADISQPS